MFPQAGDPKVIVAGTSKHIFWNYSNLNPVWSISECTLMKLLQLNVRQHGPITHAHSMTCRRTSFNMQLVPDPKVYFPGTSTLEGPQHTGPAPWGICFTHLLCFISVIFITNISTPGIHKLLKLPQLNLSDAITHAYSTTFPHGLAVIQSILFRDYFTRSF